MGGINVGMSFRPVGKQFARHSSRLASTRCGGSKGAPPPLEDVLKTMRERLAKFDVEKIKPQDLAGAGGPPVEDT